jgi:imidazoleglycerol-phosphate dehydratase
MMERTATIDRVTSETAIELTLSLDGTGKVDADTKIAFFDHMLSAFGRHGLFDLDVRCDGDIDVDFHHSVEDTGIVLGAAFREALGDKSGITRFADVMVPMDETLVLAAVDVSGRGELFWDVDIPSEKVGDFDCELGQEFFCGLAREAGVTLHIRKVAGRNAHHILEACFKAAGRALRLACEPDPRVIGVPSTKGSL